MKDILEVIEKIRIANSKEELTAIIDEVASIIGLEYYLLGYTSAESMTSPSTTIIDNYPPKWRETYEKEKLAQHDPTVDYCLNQNAPIIWEQLNCAPLKRDQKNVMCRANDYGLKTGFSIPLHGVHSEFGMFSFGSSEQEKSPSFEAIQKAQIIAPALMDKFKDFDERVGINLTKREKECLLWVSEGKSSWEISIIIGCSERTVVFHLGNATNKLVCTNRYQAVSKAIIIGLIRPMI
ncbi:LuxR family transcriptional regulator [Enterovibrio makurazakiensis]|uniref:helix-turn-helix transcriptional regulator n=1 Tax=Enterovibrio makurazakiensis TaxID=2910232 RepID=UPI003D19612B